MEEEILKYFTNNLPQESAEIKPSNIESDVMDDVLPSLNFSLGLTVSNDGNYLLRWGGDPRPNGYTTIEIYTIDSLKNWNYIQSFSDMKIYGHNFMVTNLKQDEDGRFFSTGFYVDSNYNIEDYFILYNNFIQDGFIEIRKFYTYAQMGLPGNANGVIKRNGSANYYFYTKFTSNNKIYNFQIDIINGNTMKTYDYVDDGTISSETFGLSEDFEIVNNNLILQQTITTKDSNDNNLATQYKKLVIDIDKEPTGTYHLKPIRTINRGNNIIIEPQAKNFKFYEVLLIPSDNDYNLLFRIIDLNGNAKTFVTESFFNANDKIIYSFSNNYFSLLNYTSHKLELYYFEENDENSLIKFYEDTNYTGNFSQITELKQFNLICLAGIHNRKSLSFFINVYSRGYSSTPYINKNFLIPQYLNLYADNVENINDNESIIYSRDAINRFLTGNQLTATFNVPNYLLNESIIKTERVLGQTNLAISNDLKTIQKNRFESLFFNYIYNISIIDNMNGNNQQNIIASNRLCSSIWDKLDMTQSSCVKARITKEDLTQEIIDLDTSNIIDNVCTIEFEVTGNVQKIEYISNDLKNVYATYRCNLTGTNFITQEIEII